MRLSGYKDWIGQSELDGSCSPTEIAQVIDDLSRSGWTIVWLCDPYFGRFRDQDRAWFELLSTKQAAAAVGILFAVVGGNSRLNGRDKFSYVRSLGAPGEPTVQVDDNIRSYGLFLTASARNFVRL